MHPVNSPHSVHLLHMTMAAMLHLPACWPLHQEPQLNKQRATGCQLPLHMPSWQHDCATHCARSCLALGDSLVGIKLSCPGSHHLCCVVLRVARLWRQRVVWDAAFVPILQHNASSGLHVDDAAPF
eukprot:GHRQ01019912.1.p1 GENE.GHRQ01019912.1~~GHRQ01019912.1.p1  ORF type:complete len:126 (-),score=11.60 GHRQ01019912.1:39-416(-)